MFKIHHNRTSAKFNIIKTFLLIILYSSFMPTCLLKTKMVHGKHFVIHVPMKIRTHHHTHTVYTQVHGMGKDGGGGGGGYGAGKASKQTIYKIMGYSTRHTGLAAAPAAGGGGNAGGGGGNQVHHHRHHNRNHGFRYSRGTSSYDDADYDDYLNCDESLPQPSGAGVGGDMIFNHFSRHDEEEYPDIEEVIDDEMGDEWE